MRSPFRIVIPALVSLGLFACGSSDPLTAQGLASSSVTSEKIADKSVTNVKLADGSVDARVIAQASITTPAIADNAVTSISIADGSIETSKLAAKAVVTGSLDDKAVTTAKINDAAVTAAKLDPNAAVMKLNGFAGNVTVQGGQNVAVTSSGNTVAIGITGSVNAATLGGLNPVAFARRMPNVVTVAPSNADFTTITAALNSITDASASKHYVIAVAPGLYSERVQLKQYVTVQGSGAAATTISSTGGNTAATAAAVIAVDNSELADLSVLSTGGTFTIGVYADGANATLRNVSVTSNNGASGSYGLYASNSSALRLSNGTVDVSQSNATYGLYADFAAEIRCDTCSISVTGASNDYALYESGASLKVGASLIRGPINGAGGTLHCPASYDENYVAKSGC